MNPLGQTVSIEAGRSLQPYLSFATPPPRSLILEVKRLRKSYRAPDGETRPVISVAHFLLEAGAQLAIKGASGSGKTTFLHLIAGLVQADAGSIVLDGTELTELTETKRDRLRATRVGCVYQSFNLLQGYTCLENVMLAMAFGAGRDHAFATSLLSAVGLAHRLHYVPRQLSIGQQQRVAVARALANRPKLVLADEPTGNLDPQLATETLALLREVCARQNAALLLVSHDRDILANFDHVIDFSKLNQTGFSSSPWPSP